MTATTILHEAEAELWEAVEYYESRSQGLGLDFQVEVQAAVEAIAESPDRWCLRNDGTRRCLTPRFPYVVVYVRLPDHIWIIAFAHCKRRPQYWADRIRRAEPRREPYR
jgi:toxin ParE1/3/4